MKRFFSLSIRTQLLIITLLIALPVILIIVGSAIEQRKTAVEDAYQLTQLVAERIASEQKNTSSAAEQLLVTLAQIPEVRQQNRAKVQPLLNRLKELNPQYANILVADLTGKTWATVLPFPAPSSVADRRYFKNAIATGRFSSGEYIMSRTIAKPAFNFAYPYRDETGKISGAIIVGFSLDSYSAVLKNTPLPEGPNFLLIDHNGVVLNRMVHPELIVGKKYPEQALNEMLAGPEEYSYRGMASLDDERFITYRKIRIAGETAPYMYVRVGIPVKTVMAEADKHLLKSIALFTSFLAGALVLAYLIGKRSIADRVALLQEASQRIAAGDLQVRVSDDVAGGELGLLAQSFDAMVEQLAEREQGLRDSKSRLRSITDSAQDAILMMDSNGAISYWNPAAEKILGYQAEEALGQNLHALLALSHCHAAQQLAFPEFLRTGLGEAVGTTVELTALRKDGQEIPVALSLSSVVLGGAWHAVGILRDITEIKRYQAELLEARHASDNANRAKSEFLANMSHEIRTPMNGVIGMAQLLRFTQPTKEQEEYLDNLELSSKNLLELINNILDLSRIESGKLDLESVDFSLHHSIQEVVTNQASRIQHKALTFTTEIQEQIPKLVQGDSLRFKQILMNLLGNAIKFTDSGSITISMTVSSAQKPTCTFRLMVRDTGVGMSAETVARIFNPFEQADNSTTRRYGGSGLGLSICRRLTELMGGRIWAESALGQGSTFFVELPFVARCGGDSKLPNQSFAVADLHRTKQLKLLIAEDNQINADTIQAMVKRMGHEASVAGDGSEAINMWHAFSFNCILMDISMPVMDGRQAVATIREQEKMMGGHTPIIALTARALLGDRERFLAEGFDGYVSKPVQVKELHDELARVTALYLE